MLAGVVTLTPLRESNKEHVRFVTRGVYPVLLYPLFFSLLFFVIAIYVWNIVLILIASLWLIPMLSGSFADIEVRDDGIIVKRIIFGTSYWNYDEIKFTAGGRILKYGGMYGGWIMPFKWRKCVEAVKDFKQGAPSQLRRAPSKIVPLIYFLVPPTTLALIGYLVRHVGLVINPAIWAILWGITTASSFAVGVYTAPIRFKIGGLDKAVSSIITGLIIGVIIGLFILMAS